MRLSAGFANAPTVRDPSPAISVVYSIENRCKEGFSPLHPTPYTLHPTPCA
jgi:hypothetical protein